MAFLDETGLTHLWAKSTNKFLAKSSVANNLTTTSEGYALDARQGAVLANAISNSRMPVADYIADYKTWGTDSYAYNNKDILHQIYEATEFSMNDTKLNSEALDYFNSIGKAGAALSAVYGIDASALESLNTVSDIAASSTAMNAVAASSTAMNAVVLSSVAMNAVLNSTTAMNAVFNSTTAMNAVLNSTSAVAAIESNQTAIDYMNNKSVSIFSGNSNTSYQTLIDGKVWVSKILSNYDLTIKFDLKTRINGGGSVTVNVSKQGSSVNKFFNPLQVRSTQDRYSFEISGIIF